MCIRDSCLISSGVSSTSWEATLTLLIKFGCMGVPAVISDPANRVVSINRERNHSGRNPSGKQAAGAIGSRCGALRPAAGRRGSHDGAVAVSYTHLVVSKRQFCNIAAPPPNGQSGSDPAPSRLRRPAARQHGFQLGVSLAQHRLGRGPVHAGVSHRHPVFQLAQICLLYTSRCV